MSFEIIITSFAEHDLLDALEYYNSKKTGLGDELVDELDKVFKMIEVNPEQFPVVLDKTRKAVIKRFPFNVYYIIVGPKVFVTAIFNTWRKPRIWKERSGIH